MKVCRVDICVAVTVTTYHAAVEAFWQRLPLDCLVHAWMWALRPVFALTTPEIPLPVPSHGYAVLLRDRYVSFGDDCTYLDLVLFSAPLGAMYRGRLLHAYRAVATTVLFVSAVNYARIAVCCFSYLKTEASWFWVHDVVDTVLYYPVLAYHGLSLLKRWRRVRAVASPPSVLVDCLLRSRSTA
ncbi:MAG: hypothetical protein AB7O52_14895 [Planctomycetota bacterium]